ncbi:MAG: hypothetical protein JOZ88_08095 [Hyphomicrobiales bacterium]|nr:hypothetical protein [Hyphomicrobiales bacterium]
MASATVREGLDESATHRDRLKQIIAELRQMSENSTAELGPRREDCYER